MKVDSITKAYLSDAAVFADIFNSYIYGGEQVIQPEHLVERDATKIALPYGKDGKLNPVQKQRDVQKLCAAMTDGTAEYVLYGIESQAEIHYAAPIKNALYDVMDYAKQVEEAARSWKAKNKTEAGQEQKRETKTGQEQGKETEIGQRQEEETETGREYEEGAKIEAGQEYGEKTKTEAAKDWKISSGEFLSGFCKEDRLVPVVTVMVYFGAEEWDGPMSLFDMLDVKDKRILPFLDNYRVRLIAPSQMSDGEIMQFQTNMREVLFFIKYSKDKQKMSELLEKNKARFQAVERRAADVIQAVTNAGLKYNRRKGRIDMCQALQEMIMDARAKDQKELQEMREMLQKARAEVEAEQKARIEEGKEIARTMFQSGLGVEIIAKYMKQDVAVIQAWVEE